MLCLNDGLFLKPQLSSFRSVVFQHTVILLLLTDCCGGGVVGPSQTVVTLVGEDVVLPCYLEPALDAVSKSVEWGRRDLEPRFVHVWPEGLNFLRNQNPSYKGRTSVSTEKLKHGDLSLTLSAVKISDNGAYRCYFPAHSKESTVELVVGSVSSPIIAGTQSNGRVVVLQCESGGWYPEPEVLWLDGEGNLLPAGPTETGRRPDDLYTVSSRVTVEKRHSNSFTCRVQQRRTNQIREMNIQISDYCFAATSCSAVCTSIIVAVVLVFILPAGYFVWKWRQNKIKENNIHHEDEAEPGERKITSSLLDKEERDREEHTAEKEKTVFLDEKIYNLNKDLQMNKEEYKYVLQAINTVKACRKELDKHRDFFQQLSEFIKKDIGLMEHRLDQAFRVDKKNKFQGNMEDLMEKQRVTEKLLQDTQKLLQETDDDVTQLTERKGQLELLKDQINKHLVEIKNQRDEIQVKLQTEQSERDEG